MSRIERDREITRRRRRVAKLRKLKARLAEAKDAATRKKLVEKIKKRQIYPDPEIK